ncbi:MAG: aminodeoxychorismate lyase [Acidiferrobacterales bacterium]
MSTGSGSLVNGKMADHVSINDRGLQYGDGCFETIAVQHGQALLWDEHMQRLETGCARLGIKLNGITEKLAHEAEKLVRDTPTGVLKLIITRGQGGRGYRPDQALNPTRILSLTPWPQYPKDYRAEGIAMRLCDTRLSENKTLAGIKHLNRLEQVLARSEWQDDYQEGLMLNQAGYVIEGTMSNIFMQIENEVITPAMENCGVAGVMRDVILHKLSDANIVCQQSRIDLESLYQADAIFVCNSLIGLWPVTSLENKSFPITDLERELQDAISDVCVVTE